MVHFAEKYKDGWVLVLDLRGFFMSIDKRILAEMLERFLRENYHREDIEDVIWLSRLIVMPVPSCCRFPADPFQQPVSSRSAAA